jgi:hypothetical protein
VLQYVGKKRLDWEGRIYGYDDGTFFVVAIGSLPDLIASPNE